MIEEELETLNWAAEILKDHGYPDLANQIWDIWWINDGELYQ